MTQKEHAVGDGRLARTADDPTGRAQGSINWLRSLPRSTKIALTLIFGYAILGVFGPVLAPYGVDEQELVNRLEPPVGFGGTWTHALGTDFLGRDVLSRVLYGARSSLIVGLSVVALSGLLGTTLGIFAGYRRGVTESVIMRWLEVQMAIPGLIVALVVLAFLSSSLWGVVLVLSLVYWMLYAQVARGNVLSLANSGFVDAAIISGSSSMQIMAKHIVPNLVPQISVLAVIEFARVLIAEATLSFLGFGIQPPEASWGLDIAIGRQYMLSAWWLVTVPGIALSLTVLSANYLGNWLRTRQGSTAAKGA